MPPRPFIVSIAVIAFISCALTAQQQAVSRSPGQLQAPAPVLPAGVAATVNGRPISEQAVARALRGKTDASGDSRDSILNYLIDNALVDLYLDQVKVAVDGKEVEVQFAKINKEIEETGRKLPQFLTEMNLTEAELRTQILATLRWDKFIQTYATEKTLHDFFDGNKALFDGTSMRAKHILAAAKPGDKQAVERARAKIVRIKKQIEDRVANGMTDAGKLDNLELQKKRIQLLNEIFADEATKESDCPSKKSGGELGWFPRTGSQMAEPFARAAFALKPWQMSDPVTTEFGCHLILSVEYKAGIEPKYEEMRDLVKVVYGDRMREAIVTGMRPKTKIVINPTPQ